MTSKAQIIEFKKIAPDVIVPGGQVVIKIIVKNVGDTRGDLLKGIAFLMDINQNIIEEKTLFISGCDVGATLDGSVVFTIPADYQHDTIICMGVAFHKE